MADTLDPKLLDRRTLERYIRMGLLDEKTVEKHLKSLPDVTEKAQVIETSIGDADDDELDEDEGAEAGES